MESNKKLLTYSILAFALVSSIVSLVGFFAAMFGARDSSSALNIANLYILGMILAIPALMYFLDKPSNLKLATKIGIALMFLTILVMTAVSVVALGFGLI